MKIIEIQIINTNQSNTKILHINGTLGYWVDFRHSLVEGSCYFIPYNDQKIELLKNYSVETSQEEVINITNSDAMEYLIQYNAELDLYKAIGNVSFISDDGELIIISVEDMHFSFSNEDYDIRNIRINDWIKIEIKGLTLWDEGIF
ncbi:hypothetical protein [Paenibacillus azoreducens]|uniref:Uncharacterized protein n=1 Tax=Paenibacillus azoreducens TaxID=116718 RepID=A0A919YFE9_9BACL|nr:hypothetical protein [Paenibacillus azoreducens]GIO49454.1 hypothetical protein J34TS1_42190 [Paenibacillus azoreducens]